MTRAANNAFGNDRPLAYNEREKDEEREPMRGRRMRKTLTTVRCVPRFGYDHADVRTVDLDLFDAADENELLAALRVWFEQRGITDAVYDVTVDDDGFFAIINDEAYQVEWGEPII